MKKRILTKVIACALAVFLPLALLTGCGVGEKPVLVSLTVEYPGSTAQELISGDATSFNVTAADGAKSVTITAIPKAGNISVTGDIGTQPLAAGENTFTITATTESDATRVYRIKITAPENAAPSASPGQESTDQAKSADATLKSLTAVLPDETSHDLLSAGDPLSVQGMEGVTIKAEPTEPDAKVAGAGEKKLSPGENKFSVTVTAPDGKSTKTYDFVIVCPAQSDDPTLKSFTAAFPDGSTVDLRDPVARKSIHVQGMDRVTIAATPSNGNAKITGDIGNRHLSPGDNQFSVVATAEDGTRAVYNIVINMADEETWESTEEPAPVPTPELPGDATLVMLRVYATGETWGEQNWSAFYEPSFSSGQLTYTIDAPSDLTHIRISAAANDDKAQVGGNGTYEVTTGENSFAVTVTAQNGATQTYTVIVNKAAAAPDPPPEPDAQPDPPEESGSATGG